MDYLEKVDTFFSYNLLIKKLLKEAAPTEIESYGEGIIDYPKRLENILRKILQCFEEICKLGFIAPCELEHIQSFFDSLKDQLNNCGADYTKLRNFYESITSMRNSYIKKLNSNCIGFFGLSSRYLEEAQSIHEMLHSIHMGIVNNEYFYTEAPVILKEEIGDQTKILCGEDKVGFATYFFKNVSNQLDFFEFFLFSYQQGKRIMMMLRGLGHATTIEIEIEENQSFVSYHIPKVCNVDKVNKLRGVRKLNPLESHARSSTTGSFLCSNDEVFLDLQDFLFQIPTDADVKDYQERNSDVISFSA